MKKKKLIIILMMLLKIKFPFSGLGKQQKEILKLLSESQHKLMYTKNI